MFKSLLVCLFGLFAATAAAQVPYCPPPVIHSAVTTAPSRIPPQAMIPPQVILSGYTTAAEFVTIPSNLTDAQLAAEINRVRGLLYRQRDLPQQLARIDAESRVALNDWQAAERLARHYAEFNRFIVGNPLPVSYEHQQAAAILAKERYDWLQQERVYLQRFGEYERYLNELEFTLQQRGR